MPLLMMVKDLFASKNWKHADLMASNVSATTMSAMPIHVKCTSAYAATAVPMTMTMIARNTFMWKRSRPVIHKMKNSATGASALVICRNDSER